MPEKKESTTKNLMLRLPNDEYVKLKALAEHRGTSLNSQILLAINLAAESTRGLYVDGSQLSNVGQQQMMRSPAWLAELTIGYRPSASGLFSPLETVHAILEDWLNLHSKLRNELFKLGLVVGSMDEILKLLSIKQNAFLLSSHAGENKQKALEIAESVNGLPGLFRATNSYREIAGGLKQVIDELESVEKYFHRSLDLLRNANNQRSE